MSSIMNNLLDVRKMEEGKMTLHSIPLSLEAVLNSVHQNAVTIRSTGCRFHNELRHQGQRLGVG